MQRCTRNVASIRNAVSTINYPNVFTDTAGISSAVVNENPSDGHLMAVVTVAALKEEYVDSKSLSKIDLL